MKKIYLSCSICVLAIFLFTLGLMQPKSIINLEAMTAFLACIISIGCFLYIYMEHHRWIEAEHTLSENVIQALLAEYTHIPNSKTIARYLNQTLEQQSSPELRLNTLKGLHENKKLQKAFIQEMQAIEAEHDVLETLGLNWQNSSNAHYYDLSA